MSWVFNLIWVNPQPVRERTQPVALVKDNAIVVAKDVEAVILYPALMSPYVHHDKLDYPWFEMLLATKETLTSAHVNRQLKINEGLAAEKRYHADTLFGGLGDNIEVETASKDSYGLFRTHTKFEGALHEGIEQRLTKAGFTKYFRVRVHVRALESSQRAVDPLRPAEKKDDLKWRAEYHDVLLQQMLEQRNGASGFHHLPERGLFAFKVDASHGPQPYLDRSNPIIAYHPVYLFESDEAEHLNFGHLTDIHINNRLDILKRTPVRVIEGQGAQSVSAPIGTLLQPTTGSFMDLLRGVMKDREAHALLIGGDLIDHLINAYRHEQVAADMQKVWKAVDVSDGPVSPGYVMGVDMVIFYSLLVYFCRQVAKPVFGLAGNHDCYVNPFGISPRMTGTRANAGIAADINLTLYEGILAFGPSYADFTFNTRVGAAPSSFRAEWMEWFYTVFTPFVDARTELPKQQLCCLGWGNNEDMIGGGQGTGHLPRADESMSLRQLRLIRHATDKADQFKVIVMTHFTIASYEEKLPMVVREFKETVVGQGRGTRVVREEVLDSPYRPHEGALRSEGDEDFFNMGTFEQNHDKFLALLHERKIECIFTGHSHRRAVYFVGDPRPHKQGGLAYPVTIYDPDRVDVVEQKHQKPAVIVSDCSGPYPRHNWKGEFDGWGSDVPAGTVVTFHGDGTLAKVRVLRPSTPAQPRLAVALEYADIERRMVWEQPIHVKAFLASDEARALLETPAFGSGKFRYVLVVPLHAAMRKFELEVKKITFHEFGAATAALEINVGGRHEMALDASECLTFYDYVRRTQTSEAFLSVEFDWKWNESTIVKRYTLDPWNYEIAPKRKPQRGTLIYEMGRPKRSLLYDYYDLPDFDWRAKRADEAKKAKK
jgi:hypothetical protein